MRPSYLYEGVWRWIPLLPDLDSVQVQGYIQGWTDNEEGVLVMPKGKFTPKQDRMAKHVEQSEEKRGVPPKQAKSIGYATVNKFKGEKSSGKKG